MGNLSLLELAAEVRSAAQELDDVCEKIRAAKGDWSPYALARSQAVEIAETGARQAWTSIDTLRRLAYAELERAKKKAVTPSGTQRDEVPNGQG